MLLAFLGLKPYPKVVTLKNGQECMVVDSSHTILKSPGSYCLTEDLVFTAPSQAITIASSNITLDLNGHSIRYEGKASADALAITSSSNNNITITNGSIEGFYMGIRANGDYLFFSQLHIHNICFMGLLINEGNHITIENNTIENISRTKKLNDSEGVYSIGIQVRGNGVTVQHNTIKDIYPLITNEGSSVGEGVGVLISQGSKKLLLEKNIFSATYRGTTSDIAVWLAADTTAKIISNSVTNFKRAYIGMGKDIEFIENSAIIQNEFNENIDTSAFWTAEHTRATIANNNAYNYRTALATMGDAIEVHNNIFEIKKNFDMHDNDSFALWVSNQVTTANIKGNSIKNYPSGIAIMGKNSDISKNILIIENDKYKATAYGSHVFRVSKHVKNISIYENQIKGFKMLFDIEKDSVKSNITFHSNNVVDS